MVLKLILFDVDGTLVDSQAAIVGAMHHAFDLCGIPRPSRPAILSIIGLSLPRAMAQLVPDVPATEQDALVAGYKSAYRDARLKIGAAHSPLYPGALDTLARLHAVPEYLLGVATGKSQRGLTGLLDAHELTCFVTRQVADHHPSKPHPSMILQAMRETGVEAQDTVMIGDTQFDMDMARSAGVCGIGVSWGYHAADTLGGDFLIRDFTELDPLLKQIWKV